MIRLCCAPLLCLGTALAAAAGAWGGAGSEAERSALSALEKSIPRSAVRERSSPVIDRVPYASIPPLMQSAGIPGLSLAVIRNGEIVSVRGFGVKNAKSRVPVEPDTVFEAASLSKPVLAYAVLKLVDQGRIDLDNPLAAYLPKPYIAAARVDRITARMVLSHRTGFPNWRPPGRPLEIHFDPGERFSYSGEGFVYLQGVVEQLSGEPLDSFVRRTVFDPLGMPDTSFVWRPQYDDRSAVGHDLAAMPAEKHKPSRANGAASLHTTSRDYARFVIAVIKGEGLSPRSAAAMLWPQVKLAGCTQCIGRAPAPDSDFLFWGLGWGLERTPAGDAFWHWGDNGVFRCFVMASRTTRSGAVMFTNSVNGLSIAREVLEHTIGGSHPALDLIRYERYDSPAKRLEHAVLQSGAQAAIGEHRSSRARERSTAVPDEAELNQFGIDLIRAGRSADALAVFELNIEHHPGSSGAHAALGEAHQRLGNRDRALTSLRRALELDPTNSRAADRLKALESR